MIKLTYFAKFPSAKWLFFITINFIIHELKICQIARLFCVSFSGEREFERIARVFEKNRALFFSDFFRIFQKSRIHIEGIGSLSEFQWEKQMALAINPKIEISGMKNQCLQFGCLMLTISSR